MKQGNQFIKMIVWVLAIMVSSYLLYNVIRSASSGVATTQAVLYSTTEGLSTEGFLVRQETVIPAAYDLVLPSVSEGAKVAAGEEVALCLKSAAAQERQTEIRQVEEDIRQLQQALSYQTQFTDISMVDGEILELASGLASQVAQGRLEAAASTGSSLKSLILRQEVGTDSTAGLESQLSQLRAQLTALQASAASDAVSVTASHAGYYSAVTDGYETLLTPQLLETMTLEEYENLWETDKIQTTARAAGRLIDSSKWYYVTAVDKACLEDVGKTLTVILEGDVNRELKMTVERVDRSGQEQGLLILSSRDRLSDVSALRTMKADVIFHAYSGLRVPKEAVCYSEESDSAGVYVLISGKAVWKDVELLYDNGDNYIVALDQSSTNNLWPEDAILLETEGLYDGKVVEST